MSSDIPADDRTLNSAAEKPMATNDERQPRRLQLLGATTAILVAASVLTLITTAQTPQAMNAADIDRDTPVTDKENSSDQSLADDADQCPDNNHIGHAAAEFLGLPEAQASDHALERGLKLIVECRNGEGQIEGPRAANVDMSRLWLGITDGIVTSAYRV